VHALYLASVWLHLLAAITWVGGMLFLVLVVVPWLRANPGGNAAAFLRETGRRFRNVSWVAFAVVLLTGTFNLWMRGVRLADLTRGEWLSSPFGALVLFKLFVFATVIAISLTHDLVLGPRATEAIQRDPRSAEAARIRRMASLFGRANVVLALVLVATGVMMVRGVPW
jgi:putative copper resistance protein D